MATTPEQRSRSTQPGVLITLYELDLTIYGGPVLYFHDGIAQGNDLIGFKGNTYSPFPIKAEKFEYTTKGTLPRPTLTVSNIGSVTSALLRQYQDFVGCTVTRRRTYSAYIVGGSEPDNTKEFTPDVFVVQQKTAESNTTCTFELATTWDAEGILLPRRQILANSCLWTYRSPDCSYSGIPVTNKNGVQWGPLGTNRGLYNPASTYGLLDYTYTLVNGIRVYWVSKIASNTNPLTDPLSWDIDSCRKQLSDCKLHFGSTAPLPTSAFPGSQKVG